MHIALYLCVSTMVPLSQLHILCTNNQTTLYLQIHDLILGTGSHLPVMAFCSWVSKHQKHVWHRASETLDAYLLSCQTGHGFAPPTMLLCHGHYHFHRVAEFL